MRINLRITMILAQPNCMTNSFTRTKGDPLIKGAGRKNVMRWRC
jgi:hypothetical protein